MRAPNIHLSRSALTAAMSALVARSSLGNAACSYASVSAWRSVKPHSVRRLTKRWLSKAMGSVVSPPNHRPSQEGGARARQPASSQPAVALWAAGVGTGPDTAATHRRVGRLGGVRAIAERDGRPGRPAGHDGRSAVLHGRRKAACNQPAVRLREAHPRPARCPPRHGSPHAAATPRALRLFGSSVCRTAPNSTRAICPRAADHRHGCWCGPLPRPSAWAMGGEQPPHLPSRCSCRARQSVLSPPVRSGTAARRA